MFLGDDPGHWTVFARGIAGTSPLGRGRDTTVLESALELWHEGSLCPGAGEWPMLPVALQLFAPFTYELRLQFKYRNSSTPPTRPVPMDPPALKPLNVFSFQHACNMDHPILALLFPLYSLSPQYCTLAFAARSKTITEPRLAGRVGSVLGIRVGNGSHKLSTVLLLSGTTLSCGRVEYVRCFVRQISSRKCWMVYRS